MFNMNEILMRLQMTAARVSSEIIKDLIQDNTGYQTGLIKKYNAYKAVGLPISSRKEGKANKANNKLINDYRGEIVDQLTGYLFGNPVTYSLNPEAYDNKTDSSEYKAHVTELKEFKQINKLEELDGETGKFMSACGRAARLLYIDTKGKTRVMAVPPWECIFIYDQSLDQTQYALRYYNVYEMIDGKPVTKIRVEWYDRQNVYYFIGTQESGYMADVTEVLINNELKAGTEQAHQFNMVPLIDFQNNTELLGDFEKTESLIDGYDRLLSDAQNEIEDLRQAYLLFKGVTPDDAVIKKAKESGAFGCEAGDSIEYLTKQLNDTFVENQKKSLRENIYRFSKTVDVSADTFTGSGASGEARKWLLLALENRGSKMALKFKSGVLSMFSVAETIWQKKGIDLTAADIQIDIDRNLPVELKLESEIQTALKGVISDRTRLKLFSPVRDVDEELKQMAEENDGMVNLDNVPPDNNAPDPEKEKAMQADMAAMKAGTMTQAEYDAKWSAE